MTIYRLCLENATLPVMEGTDWPTLIREAAKQWKGSFRIKRGRKVVIDARLTAKGRYDCFTRAKPINYLMTITL